MVRRSWRNRRTNRRGAASLEVVLTTAIAVPLAGFMLLLGILICRYVFRALSGLLLLPFL